MLTKDELLQKEISEEDADEIIAAFDENVDSLQTLEKALGEEVPEMDLFVKAEKGGEDEDSDEDDEDKDKDDYNENFMKKHMKRYMKENEKSCGKMAKEVGVFGENMSKAISEFDTDAEGAIVEMIDLKPILEGQMEFNSVMAKAIEGMSAQIDMISAKSEDTFSLMSKSARVQVEQAKGMGEYLSQPTGRKGAVSNVVPMQKAEPIVVSADGQREIYAVLEKAMKDGDSNAGLVMSAFESNGKDVNRLNLAQRQIISNLIKEGK